MFQTSKDIFIVAKKKLYSLIKNDNFKFKLIGSLNDLFGINEDDIIHSIHGDHQKYFIICENHESIQMNICYLNKEKNLKL